MYRNFFNKIVLALSVLCAVGCANLDSVGEITTLYESGNIAYKINGVSDTKAYWVTTDNVELLYPEMVVKGVINNAVQFTDTMATSTTETVTLKQKWVAASYTFYSYPNGIFDASNEVRFKDNCLMFNYTIAKNSTDTPDIVVARTEQTKGKNVELTYNHVFTSINIIYDSLKMGHTISKIAVKNVNTEGKCKVANGAIYWEPTSGAKDNLIDENVRYATINNTPITEDGCKFMIIPNVLDGDVITIEVVIDGVTVKKDFTGKTKPGEVLNFHIKDNFTIKKEDGSEATGKIEMNPDSTYKMTMESYVTGEFKKTIVAKPADFMLVLDYSGSMTDSYTDPKKSSYTAYDISRYSYENWTSTSSSQRASKFKVYYKGADRAITCAKINSTYWAYFDLDGYRYYVTLDGGVHKTTNTNPSSTNMPVDESGNYVYPVTTSTDFVFGVISTSSTNIKNRINGLRGAVSDFIDSVKNQESLYGVTHNLSIIEFKNPRFPQFTSTASDRAKYRQSSEPLYYLRPCDYYYVSGASSSLVRSKESTGVLFPFASPSETNMHTAMKASLSLPNTMYGCTAIDYGMYIATLQMGEARTDADLGKFVIVFTDGKATYSTNTIQNDDVIPGYNTTGSTKSDSEVETGAVNFSQTLKNNGWKVYSVGVFKSTDKPSGNFLERLSSGTGYYTDASSGSLSEVFQKIAKETCESTIDIHEDAYIKSVISDAFVLPADYADDPNNIHFYEVKQTGYDSATKKIVWSTTRTDITDQITYNLDPATQTVTIYGFDYGGKYCTTNAAGPFTGSKLVMEFNNLPVNPEREGTGENLAIEYSTGLYNPDGTPVTQFQPIYVNL